MIPNEPITKLDLANDLVDAYGEISRLRSVNAKLVEACQKTMHWFYTSSAVPPYQTGDDFDNAIKGIAAALAAAKEANGER